MSKIDEIRSEMVAAMKAGDKERKAALSFLLSSLKNKAIDKRADLTEEEEGQVILKEIKQLKETLEMTPADRTDLIETREIDGRQCLVIAIDGGVEVNGITVTPGTAAHEEEE